MWLQVVKENLEPVYRLASAMTLDAADREEIVLAAFSRVAQNGVKEHERKRTLLFHAAHAAEAQQRKRRHLDFDTWDAHLREEQPEGTTSLRQDDVALWQLRRGCLVTTLCCLPAGERAAFALSEPLQLEAAEAATVLGISASALRVRLSRARSKVARFLGPRCELVNARNSCQCAHRHKSCFSASEQVVVDTQRLRQAGNEPLVIYQCCRERPPKTLRARIEALTS